MRKLISFIAIVFVLIVSQWAYADTHVADSCSAADVNTAISAAGAGDTVTVSGTCTWTSAAPVTVNKAITLDGSGATITIGAGTEDGGIIIVSAAASVSGFSISNTTSSQPIQVIAGGTNARITGSSITSTGHGINVNAVYCLIDNNTFYRPSGQGEIIQVTGPCDSWDTANSIGGADNVFIEYNSFNGCKITCNSDSRCVVRYNTLTGAQGIVDIHQRATSTNTFCTPNHPAGGRHIEIYNNYWDTPAWSEGMAILAGTSRIHHNYSVSTSIFWYYKEYMLDDTTAPFSCDAPITHQVGTGLDGTRGGEPAYAWNNTHGAGTAFNLYVVAASSQWADGCSKTAADMITLNTDYFRSEPVGYTTYTCPHPLTGLTGGCDESIAGTSGYNVAGESPSEGVATSNSSVLEIPGLQSVVPGAGNVSVLVH